jgi:hypothetical protein
MNHSDLVKEARELAAGIEPDPDPAITPTRATREGAATTLITLANIVETQDMTITRLSEAADKPDPVCEHADLLEEARILVDELAGSTDTIVADGGRVIRNLVDLVGRQDRSITELTSAYQTIKEACAGMHDLRQHMEQVAAEPDPVRDEAVAACVVCDEVMTNTLSHIYTVHPSCKTDSVWRELSAARHLARRAAKLADDPTTNHQPQRLAKP